jgi:hypothetical protein
MREIEAACGFGLPAVLQSDRTKQLHVVLVLALDERLGIDIAPINDMPGFEDRSVALTPGGSVQSSPSRASRSYGEAMIKEGGGMFSFPRKSATPLFDEILLHPHPA